MCVKYFDSSEGDEMKTMDLKGMEVVLWEGEENGGLALFWYGVDGMDGMGEGKEGVYFA